ncbi:kinase-like protein [Thelephora terrestris]|uniref:Kinase-like protein n=1 Tax=Thelephora terrestris TaxID=56493 RepID=A0A9P6LAL6_9AGAM|nr:kinase-like protein [Thelephora terrestris]
MTSDPNPLDQLLRLKPSSSGFDDKVSNVLQGQAYRTWVKGIGSDDVVELAEFLDRALDVLDPAGPGFRRCLRQLRNTCGARMILPKSYTPASQSLAVGAQPVASGGSGDVYEGTLNGSKVCVKRVRMYLTKGPEEATKTLYQEAIMWKRLDHKNIVPLLGMTKTPLQLISEWIPGGNLTEYIIQHSNANRRDLARDIAEGLYYLHSRNVVHGDLKGPNILVDATGRARITDFGLATVTQNVDSFRSTAGEPAHTPRWTAPEILGGEGSHSTEADVFSFAMVMIEVFTGAVPFNRSPSAAAMVMIMKGERPPRPTHQELTNDLWKIIQQCWNQDPHLRPEVSKILSVLGITWVPLSSVDPG